MALSSSSFLSTPPLPSSKSTISFASSVSPSPIPSLRRVVFRPHRRATAVRSKIREIFMPALSSTMTEGKIVSWLKTEGEKLAKGQSVVVVESDKADMDVETFYDGYLAAIVVGEGETAPVGAAIGLRAKPRRNPPPPLLPSPPPPPPAALSPAPAIAQPVAAVSDGPRKTVATPYAKKLAKQHKVDIGSVAGTGPFGRITAADVEAAAGIAPSVSQPPPPAPTATVKATSTSSSSPPLLPDASVVPFTAMQSAVSKNMIESLSVPTFRVGYPVNTDALDALYEKVKPKGVTMTALLAKAAGMALAQHPVVNASCKDGKSFSYNSNINVAVAVAINGGLITPVLQDADKLDLYLLSQKWKELVGKARSKQLQPHEYNSGTFTLSNLGMFGVDRFDAILPPGQGAIMAVGASKPTVVADKDGFFSVKNKMLVNVTADHRIVYGADLAAFLQTFAKIVENPDSLTL
ncbi:Dihydrolipoyllysine-residue acetyltransferase component 4 of pyruvate dehydrogenase complex [Hirschfeldia incana]|nr:Dihydrolipoyllysine-residue acetyltransferase component 4 of pyruvate dehydrogenase complex [Hirschfeldia incana]